MDLALQKMPDPRIPIAAFAYLFASFKCHPTVCISWTVALLQQQTEHSTIALLHSPLTVFEWRPTTELTELQKRPWNTLDPRSEKTHSLFEYRS